MTQIASEERRQEEQRRQAETGTGPLPVAPKTRRLSLADAYGLVLTPFVLASLAFLLWWWVQSQDISGITAGILAWDNLSTQIWQHIRLALVSTFFVLLFAIPAGILVTRPWARRIAPFLLGFANIGQAFPAYGLIVLLFTWLGTGFRTAIVALAFYSILPVLRNTMVGLEQVDRSTIEAGRGMGMTKLSVLRRIELPLAVPVMLAGIRTALIINVGTAALAFIIGAGGLGVALGQAITLQRNVALVAAASITALLALTLDWLAAIAEKILRPRGL